MVMVGPSETLIPEMTSPSPQFLSLSSNLHPSFRVNDFLDVPLELDELLALELVVPSKLAQKARAVTFLNELTWVDCEDASDCEALALEPLGPLLWLELELDAEEDCDDDEVSSTCLKMKPATT